MMLSRRDFLKRSSLIATSAAVPGFIERTAHAAEPGKDSILVVLEMTGGNDGLNTVVPYRDDDYHRLRPSLGFQAAQVVKVNDDLGLHPALQQMGQRSEEHTSELQSLTNLVCRLLLEKKKKNVIYLPLYKKKKKKINEE